MIVSCFKVPQDRPSNDLLFHSTSRFQQGELLGGFNDMKTALTEYLRQFAEEGKVVTAEDIRQFFQEMETKKKSKGIPQYHCG